MMEAVQLRIAILASHDGSNAEAVMNACANRVINARVVVIVSNNSKAPALERARERSIPTTHLSTVTHPDPDELDTAMLFELREHQANLIVMAGYMKKLGPKTLAAFTGHVINVHPALLPRHGGQGMFGQQVHEAVLRANEKTTGVTIHLADAEYDHGAILAQREVPVLGYDTPDTLSARVQPAEHDLLVQTLARIATGDLTLPGDEGSPSSF
jgi:phosphoribosylglycinamide formyltransferase-1